jgi:transcriptional regulator with XRE-family HTH domain
MSDALKKKVAAAIRTARNRSGLSQEELSHRAGISLPTLSNIERGVSLPSLENFAALVAELDLDPRALLQWDTRTAEPSRDQARIEAEIMAHIGALNDRDTAVLLDVATSLAKNSKR